MPKKKSRWDVIELRENKGRAKKEIKESANNQQVIKERETSVEHLTLPDVAMPQDSIGTSNSHSSGNTSWLSQFSFGQILMLLSVIPIIVVLVCISMACVKFFTSPMGTIASVVITGVAFFWIMKRGGGIL